MNYFHFSSELSAWWLLVIIAVSAGLAWLFYTGKNVWNTRLRWLLGCLRFTSVFLVLLLLINPSITFLKSFRENAVFPILVDNSQSAILAGMQESEIKNSLNKLIATLNKKGFDTPVFIFDSQAASPDSFTFNHPSSDLFGLISSAEESMLNKKESKMLLISDGLFNTGNSPAYQPYRSDIYTLGYGDTLPRKDLVLKSVQNNSIAFVGNKFTIRADLQATGYSGQTIEVLLKNFKGVLDKKVVSVKGDFFQESIDFITPAENKGFQKYSIEIKPVTDESNLLNNNQTAYVEVVDDRENILIISLSPHPNIKAIRTALLKAENINIELLIPGISTPKTRKFDLVIFHNCLKSSMPDAASYISETTSLFYIAGSGTDYTRFNTENGLIEVLAENQTDQAQAVINPSFSRFKTDTEAAPVISGLPPLEVTFGDIRLKGASDILLYQKINGIQTEKPLLVFGENKRKTGVLLTDGIWLWRMYEAQANDNSKNTDEILTKTVQYLSSKQDKRKFRIYPFQKEYFEAEQVMIETELYNDIFERITEGKIMFTLYSDDKKIRNIAFNFSEGNTALSLRDLKAGVYKITASTESGGRKLGSTTEFIVKERQLEALDLKANHQLLRELSKKNGGNFYSFQQLDRLLSDIDKFQAKAIWKSTEKTHELINELWYFYLIIAFLTAEWLIRRYTGGY